jgi:hypothetical protein
MEQSADEELSLLLCNPKFHRAWIFFNRHISKL